MKFAFFLLLLSFHIRVCSQSSELKIVYSKNIYHVHAIKFHENYYFSLSDFVKSLSIPNKINNSVLEVNFDKSILLVTPGHPYLIIKDKENNHSETFQLPVSVIAEDNRIYLPLNYSLEALSTAFNKEVYLQDSLSLVISGENISPDRIVDKKNLNGEEGSKALISKILLYEKSCGLVIRLFSDKQINSYKSSYMENQFTLLLADSEIKTDSISTAVIDLKTDIVKNVRCRNINDKLEITLDLLFDYNFSEVSKIPGTYDLNVRINVHPDPSDWFRTESENFIAIYRESHSSLIPYIIRSAENSLRVLMKIFAYTPSEKIIINTYDVSDYGFGATTTIPQNYIRLEIEPFEPGYENIPYNERLQWLLNHELVHIVVNDQASSIENASRKIFQKVEPEQVQPITVFYSILTNYSRYTPRWHQEAIAVFFETWMSGGFGRILGNFDEMYFRTMVLDGQEFPHDIKLDAIASQNSFLIETLFYLYGARFATYLSIKYGSQKLIDWFKISSGDFYHAFKNKFEMVFNSDFDTEWSNFIENEKQFQKGNLERLKSAETTHLKRIKDRPVGFATNPYFDPVSESVFFGYHQPHHLASIQKLDLKSGVSNDIETLPTPSQFQVASTAFDYKTGYFFFTTNNNQLYRDVWVLDIETKETKLLFQDSRIGQLTVSPQTHELWGVKHSGGKAAIIYSPYPYNILEQVTEFSVGDEIQQLSVSPSGKYLATTLLTSNGDQSIILINCDNLRKTQTFKFDYVTTRGSPENPSWSMDGKFLFWNSYTNGVSNIYRRKIGDKRTSYYDPEPLTHTLRGLFKPIDIGSDSLFAFEFTSEGLVPVIIQNKPVNRLPAIQYLGQEVIKRNPSVYNMYVADLSEANSYKFKNTEEDYNALENLKIRTFVPVISGFQKQKMLGIFTHISDPLLIHDLTMEMGYSPFNENPIGPKWHFKGKYEYKKQYVLGIDHNAPDFYDLFNERKRGLIGTKIYLGNTYYWIYDNPLKVKQNSEIAFYMGQEFINDNLVRVSEPNFAVAQTVFNSRNLRKTIGSSDFEYGNEYSITLMLFGTKPEGEMKFAGQFFAEWDHFTTFIFAHNVFHFKLAAGYHYKNEYLSHARFFFGGFGNRALENVDVKQFRKVFGFPGIPIYSLDAERFVKIMVENNLPPLRFSNLAIGNHFLNYIDFSVYSQALYTKAPLGAKWIDIGAQLNLVFKHWFNLESTFSAGIANAWFNGGDSWEWFLSYKLLRN